MRKKLLSLVLVLTLCVGLISSSVVTVNAANTYNSSTTSNFYYYTLKNASTSGLLTYSSSGGFTVSKSCTATSQNFAFLFSSSKKVIFCESDSSKYVGVSSVKENASVQSSSSLTYWVVQSVSGGVIIKPYNNQNLALTATSSGKAVLQKFSSSNKAQIWSLTYVKSVSDSVSISGSLSSSSVEHGSTISASGTIASSLTILSSIKVSVLNSSNKEVASKTITPSSGKTYSVSTCVNALSSQIKSLSVGTYTIKVVATNANNKSATWSKSFTVKYPSSKTLITSANLKLIQSTGKQTTSLNCGCFALVYCREIIDGVSHVWTEFRVNSTTLPNSASWSKASYTSKTGNSASSVYKAIYDQINAGKPVVICVTSGRSSSGTHYVAVVGYTGVTDTSNLSASNFIIIDSAGSGTCKEENMGTVGYKLKNYTYYVYSK